MSSSLHITSKVTTIAQIANSGYRNHCSNCFFRSGDCQHCEVSQCPNNSNGDLYLGTFHGRQNAYRFCEEHKTPEIFKKFNVICLHSISYLDCKYCSHKSEADGSEHSQEKYQQMLDELDEEIKKLS